MAEQEQIYRISFVALGKCRERKLLCTWNNVKCGPAEGDTRIPTIKKLLEAADKRLTPGQRQKLEWDGATVFCMKEFPDGEMLYTILVINDEAEEYPERIAYGFLADLKKKVDDDMQAGHLVDGPEDDSMSAQLAEFITQQALTYDDPGEYDKLARVQAKTKAVQQLMRGNIGQMLKNTENLNVLDEQTQAMEQEALEYDDTAEEIKDYFWWKDCRVTVLIIIGIMVLALIVLKCSGCLECISGGNDAHSHDAGSNTANNGGQGQGGAPVSAY
ncbi:unnamed protein product [Amoebophrya sp. A120]|nr:unnamed protein product [Amoebophrya sp. A120]|eukprot:GSA120T00017068001.1